MHWLAKIVLVVGGNAFALWLANKYVAGFVVSADWKRLLVLAFILALLNFILKPIVTLVLGPVIILTLGLGFLIVNAAMIYVLQFLASHLDILRGSLSIETIPALIYATLIVTALNLLIHLAT